MKLKYKLKSKPKYQNGVQELKTYTPEELQARQLQGTSGLETGVDKGIEGVAGKIPIAAGFMAAGKALHSGIGQFDKYGVASSDTSASIANVAAPHKTTFGYLQDGKVADALGSLVLPFGFSAKRNRELRGERDELIRQQQAENNKLAFQGTDETLAQSGQIYKTGTSQVKGRKKIEAEGGELVFSKIGNKYKLKADLKGPSHKQGGIDLTVSEGDVIVPKADAKSVRKMVDKNGIANNQFNGYRLKLPIDQPKAENGDQISIGVGNGYGRRKSILDQPTYSMPQYTNGNVLGSLTDSTSYVNRQPLIGGAINRNITTSTTTPVAPVEEESGNKFGGYLNTAAQLAPALYNIGQGLFGKVEKEKANFVSPELLKYKDLSAGNRRASTDAYRIQASNARNLGAGNAGNIRANLNQANIENFQRQQDINNVETGRALDIMNANTGLKNQYRLLNAQEKARVNNINSQNAAVKRDYLQTGLGSLANYAQAKKDDQAIENQNEILASALGTANYTYDKKTRKYKLKK